MLRAGALAQVAQQRHGHCHQRDQAGDGQGGHHQHRRARLLLRPLGRALQAEGAVVHRLGDRHLQAVHQEPPLTRGDPRQGRLPPLDGVDRQHRVELGHLARDQLVDPLDGGRPAGNGTEAFPVALEQPDGGVVRLAVRRLPGQDVAALRALGAPDGGEGFLQLDQHAALVHRLIADRDQAPGAEVGERNDADQEQEGSCQRDEQPGLDPVGHVTRWGARARPDVTAATPRRGAAAAVAFPRNIGAPPPVSGGWGRTAPARPPRPPAPGPG